jgi:hypothetical protein
MNERQELELRKQLEMDEQGRDRGLFNYTNDALSDYGFIPLSVWPESNKNVAEVLSGDIDYESLPQDIVNEFHKGMAWTEQQDVILHNQGKEILCEANGMQHCLQDNCELFNTRLTPPICTEYKIAFKK